MRLRVLLVFSSLIMSLACTRQANKSQVSLALTLPAGIGAQSAEDIQHLSLSVSGPESFLIEWDKHSDMGVAQTSFQFELEPGQYLIQVAVFVGGDTGGGFQYGDVSTSLSGGTKTVAIATTPISSSTGTKARVEGRFVSTPLLSGSVLAYFDPPNGRPEMPVLQTEMIGGWFNFFAIDGISFRYVHEESETILFNSVEVIGGANPEILINGNSLQSVADNNVLQVYVPNHYRSNGSGADTSHLQSSGVILLGYFGAVTSSHETCSLTPSGTYNSGNPLYQHPSSASYLDYDLTTFDSTKVSKLGSPGLSDCTAAANSTAWNGHIPWYPDLLTYSGFESSNVVNPPFAKSPTGTTILTAPSGANLDIFTYVLPEIFSDQTPGGLDGIDFYIKNDSNVADFDINDSSSGPTCEDAEDEGFTFLTSLDSTDCPSNFCTINITNRDPTKDAHLLACPSIDGVYLRNKVRVTEWRDFSFVTFTYSMPATTHLFVLPNTPALNCRLVTITPDVAPNFDVTLNLTKAGTAAYGIYDSADTSCTGSAVTQVDFPAGSSAPKQIRVKSTSLGTMIISPNYSTDPMQAAAFVAINPLNISSGYMFCVSSSPFGACGSPSYIALKKQAGGSTVINESGRDLYFTFSPLTNLDTSVCGSYNTNFIAQTLDLVTYKSSAASGASSLVSSDPDVSIDPGCATLAW